MFKYLNSFSNLIFVFYIFIFQSACVHENNKITGDEDSLHFETMTQENVRDSEIIPTRQYASLSELIGDYKMKFDSFDRIKKEYLEKGKSDTLALVNASHIQDSIFKLTDHRSITIYNYLQTHEKNKDNFEGLKYLVINRTVSSKEIDELFIQYPESLKLSLTGEWVSSQIKKRKVYEGRTSYNKALLDYSFIDTQNKKFLLREITTNFILLDFWASWCSPCRYENKILVKKMDLIHGSGVTIVAVSLDESKNKWLQASIEDGLTYSSIWDPLAFNSFIAKEFEISSIPFNVLIDKKGQILGNNLWGNKLIVFIDSLEENIMIR